MLKGCNLAFLPQYNSKQFIQLANNTSIGIERGRYRLGAASLPHVSICHFILEEAHIESIWKQVQALAIPPVSLTFSTRKAKIYPPDSYCDVTQCGISLIPNNRDVLIKIHLQIANIIQKPLNAAFAHYDPHLTLFNSHDIEVCDRLNQAPALHSPLKDTFVIALGGIDRIGQITHVLFTSTETNYVKN